MWIERVDFAGFGNLSGDRVEFKPNKVNLVVAPNDFGKSTIADALWAIIFDFPRGHSTDQGLSALREARRPNRTQLPYIASLDVTVDGRELKVIRDFEDGSVQVFDRKAGLVDITDEFLTTDQQDIGLRLCGVTREVFLSAFFAGQKKLHRNSLQGNDELLAALRRACESSAGSQSAGTALQILSQELNQCAYKGTNGKLDTIIRGLESRQTELKIRISSLEMNRQNLASELSQLVYLKRNAKTAGLAAKAQEYFDLCMRIADLDDQLIKARGTVNRKRDLQSEFHHLSSVQEFPIQTELQVNELWARRKARIEDYQRSEQQTGPQRRHFEEHKAALREKFPGCEFLSTEDIQNLTLLANAIAVTQKEVRDLAKRRQVEASRVRDESSVDMDRVDEMRKSLHPLAPREVDSARQYDALIMAANAQMIECERLIAEARVLVNEVEEEKKNKKAVFFNSSAQRKREGELAEIQIQQQTELKQQLANKIANLQQRLTVLATKAGLTGAEELLQQVNEYSTKSVAVKDIEALDQVLSTREAILSKNKLDLKPYFEKAKMGDVEITAEAAKALSSDAGRYVDEVRTVETRFAPVAQAIQHLENMQTEINNLEGLLESIFMGAGLANPSDLDGSYTEFQRKAGMYKQLQAVQKELAVATEVGVATNTEEENRLEAERNQTFARMQSLVQLHPEIAEMPPPSPGAKLPNLGSDTTQALEVGTEKVRAALASFDETYLESIKELDGVEYDLTHLRQARAAIELARETLQRVANESSYDWLDGLNLQMRQSLTRLGLEFEGVEFGTDLRLSVRLKGQSNASAHIANQMSSSAKQHVHLLSRLVVCEAISRNKYLPIVLDEAFSETDDETFLRVMKFLIDVVAPKHQIIIFSCNRIRWQWLMENLSAEQKKMIAMCSKSSLRQDALKS